MTDTPNIPPPPTVKVDIKLEVGLHPKDRVLAVEYFTKALCKAAKLDPAEATMMLLTAAVHIATSYSKQSPDVVIPELGKALGAAVGASLAFWPPKDGKPTKILHS